jgi:predicted DNA-binding transcriptional regulator YafY
MPAKHSEAKPAEKLLSLYSLLIFNGGHQFSLSELAERMDCSKQTVLRLIDQMESSEYGKIVRNKMGREAVYTIERPRNLPHMALNAEGLFQLALCRNLLLHLLPRGMRKQADIALRNAGTYAQEPIATDDVSIGQTYTKGRIDYTAYQHFLKTFIQAMHTHKVCAVTYKRSLKQEARGFEFAPMKLIAYHETFSLLGWEVTDKGKAQAKYENPVSLYLHRFEGVELTHRGAEHLPVPASAQNTEGSGLFGVMQGEEFSVKAHFAPEAATYVQERQWSVRQNSTVHDDGSVTLDFDAQSEAEVVSWLLGFGERVTVLEPGWLREEIGRQATEVAGKYYETGNKHIINAGEKK